MGFQLSWQSYAEWLASIQGMDIYDAVNKAGRLYTKQTNKDFELDQAEEIIKFWEFRERERDAIDKIEI